MSDRDYMVEVEAEIGPEAELRYRWNITINPTPNQHGKTVDDVLAYESGFSGRSVRHAPSSGYASSMRVAEAEAELAIDIEEANLKLREQIAADRTGVQRRYLVQKGG